MNDNCPNRSPTARLLTCFPAAHRFLLSAQFLTRVNPLLQARSPDSSMALRLPAIMHGGAFR
jgi:hypothetical protein